MQVGGSAELEIATQGVAACDAQLADLVAEALAVQRAAGEHARFLAEYAQQCQVSSCVDECYIVLVGERCWGGCMCACVCAACVCVVCVW